MTILDVEAQFTQLSRGDDNGFHQLADAVAAFQFEKNEIFNRFCSSLGASPAECYLPIGAFKAAPVASFDVEKTEAVFE